MYEEKQICSHNWSRSVKKRLKRLASILEMSESELSEKGMIYFIEHSDVCKQALAKAKQHDKFLDGLVKQRHTVITKKNGTTVYEYRPEVEESEEE